MIVIVETPDDAAYTFSHPAGGPTSMGPSWRAQLGRFGLLEMTNHEFLDVERHKERTTFADGTTVTIDWQANTVEIAPAVT